MNDDIAKAWNVVYASETSKPRNTTMCTPPSTPQSSSMEISGFQICFPGGGLATSTQG